MLQLRPCAHAEFSLLPHPERAYNSDMENLTTRNVADIPAGERAAIEHLLGRSLVGEEKVFIMTFTPGLTADPVTRAAARERLEKNFEAQRQRASEEGIGEAEADQAVDEAMRHVRRRPE